MDPARTLVMFRDITAIQKVIDAIPIAIFAKDSASRFVLMNKACELQWGLSYSDLRGTTGSQFFPPEQLDGILAKDREIFERGHLLDYEESFWNAELQEIRFVHTFKNPLFDGAGKPLYLVCVTVDITDHRLATDKLLLSEEKLRTMFELSPLGIARNSMDGVFFEANASFLNIVGYTLDALNRTSYWELTPESYADQEAQQLESLRTRGRYGPYEKEYINSRGQRVPVRLNGVLITGSDGEQYIWSMVEDISLLSDLVDQLRVAAAAFESQEAMMITDASTVILRVNQAFIEITGYTAEDAVGQTPRLLKSGRHDAGFFHAMWESINDTGGWQGEIWNRRKSGEEYPNSLTITAMKNDKGAVTHYIGVHHDITQRKQAEEKISELAFFDQLTGLPNRTLLLDRLKQAMAAGSRTGRFGALLFIDLDHFKTLNDTLGHDKGDLLLKQVAQRLTKCVRAGDTMARLGGDEFVVMLAGLSLNEGDAAALTKTVGEKILSALNLPYHLNQVAYHSTASIGATTFKGDLVAIDELMKQADLAMYKSKEAGRNALHFFDPRMESAVKERAAAEDDLRSAVEEKRFVLHYQAQVVDRRIIGAEALVRWQHPKRGLVYPDGFITLSEETGLILPLGRWVLETACDQLAAWAIQPEMSHLTIAVNVSVNQIRQPDFVDQVLSVLARSGANPQRLKLELTESVMIINTEDTIAKMAALKAKGVGFSLDDFGTGYSSLSYLKRLPLGQLKIDRGFVKDILIDPIDAGIAKMIITLGENLGLAVIAEGVETEAQRDFLVHQGCRAYQGYLFSRPLPLDAFEDFVKQAR
jgi:diguanylate cyclase (GGDEF)-like protein/PAS domain S-box-containing protein